MQSVFWDIAVRFLGHRSPFLCPSRQGPAAAFLSEVLKRTYGQSGVTVQPSPSSSLGPTRVEETVWGWRHSAREILPPGHGEAPRSGVLAEDGPKRTSQTRRHSRAVLARRQGQIGPKKPAKLATARTKYFHPDMARLNVPGCSPKGVLRRRFKCTALARRQGQIALPNHRENGLWGVAAPQKSS